MTTTSLLEGTGMEKRDWNATIQHLRRGKQTDFHAALVSLRDSQGEPTPDGRVSVSLEHLCNVLIGGHDAIEAADTITDLARKNEELRAALAEAEKAMTCGRDDAAHYCPNCDCSIFDARAKVRTALAQASEPRQ